VSPGLPVGSAVGVVAGASVVRSIRGAGEHPGANNRDPATAPANAAPARAAATRARPRRREARTARTNAGTSETRGETGPSSSTEVSRGTTERIPGIPANEATAAAQDTQHPRWPSYSRRSAGDRAPSTYAASQSR